MSNTELAEVIACEFAEALPRDKFTGARPETATVSLTAAEVVDLIERVLDGAFEAQAGAR